MIEKEALVDTAFLQKLSCEGKRIDNFTKVLSELKIKPIIHPYIAKNELDMYPYFNEMVSEGIVKIIEYNDFLADDFNKELYKSYFLEIHNKLRERLENGGGKKKLDKLVLPSNIDVFTYRKAGMSLGDVHMILMAFFIKVPIILTEDADIEILKKIIELKINSDKYNLKIYSAMDLLVEIAEKNGDIFGKKELNEIAKSIEGNAGKSKINQVWGEL